MNIPSSITTMLAGIVLTLVSLWFGQHHGLLPIAASKEADLVDGLFNVMMTISVGLFLVVQGALIISAIRFRRREGDDSDGPPVHGNVPLEILWTAIPAVIVLGISVYSFEVYNAIGGFSPMDHSVAHAKPSQQMAAMPGAAIAATLDQSATATDNRSEQIQTEVTQDPATATVRNEIPQLKDSGVTAAPRVGPTPDKQGQPPEFVVNVTGLQFAWIFTYPETGVVSGQLHLPSGREVKLNISANDVLHAFWVPEFRLKQDAVPGRQTELRFTPTRVGEYPVICAELCGSYHGGMKTQAIVQTPEDFDAWQQSQKVAMQTEMQQAIAVNPTDLPTADFLAPYGQELGVNAATLHQIPLHTAHHHHS